MLVNLLNTNEVKNAAGTEVEFSRLSTGVDRSTTFRAVTEAPAFPYRLTIKHSETGVGTAKVRRSVVRFDKSFVGQVDATKTETCAGYAVMQIPVGNMTAMTEATNVLANLISFCASLGASTTILYDGTGNGAVALLNGDL